MRGGVRRTIRRAGRGARGVFADKHGPVLATVALGWLLVLGTRFVVPAVLPAIKAEFATSNAAAGLAVAIIWVAYAGMQFPAGVLADRIGERTLLAGSTLLAGTSLLLFGAVPTFGLFLVAAAAFGFGTGLFGPSRGTVLAKTFGRRDGMAFGVVLAAGSVGAAALPFLGSLITVRTGWRVAMAAFAPALLLVAVGLWWAVPAGLARDLGESRSFQRDLAVIRGSIRRRSVLTASIGAMLMLFVFQGLTAFYTTYLVEAKGLAQGTAGGLLALLFLSGAVFQSVAGTAADRYGHGRVLALVSAASVPPLVALTVVDGFAGLAAVAIMLGIRPAIGPVSNAYIIGVLPDDVQGATWGLLRTGFFTVGSFGSVAVGVLADRDQFGEAFLALAGLTAVAAVLYLFLPARTVAAPGANGREQ